MSICFSLMPEVSKEPAHWAIQRAIEPSGQKIPIKSAEAAPVIQAFASYVPEHELPPPDPLFAEARNVIAQCHEAMGMPGAARAVQLGKCDSQMMMQFIMADLCRGIQLGQDSGADLFKNPNGYRCPDHRKPSTILLPSRITHSIEDLRSFAALSANWDLR